MLPALPGVLRSDLLAEKTPTELPSRIISIIEPSSLRRRKLGRLCLKGAWCVATQVALLLFSSCSQSVSLWCVWSPVACPRAAPLLGPDAPGGGGVAERAFSGTAPWTHLISLPSPCGLRTHAAGSPHLKRDTRVSWSAVPGAPPCLPSLREGSGPASAFR